MTSPRQIFVKSLVLSCLLATSLFPVANAFTTESREKDDDVTTVQPELESSVEPKNETSSGRAGEIVQEQAADFEDPCPGHAPSPFSESTYFLYENGYWLTTDCPEGARFNPVACCCYYALAGIDTSPRPDQPRYIYSQCEQFQADLYDIRRYRERAFNGWTEKTCPAGFGFDRIGCRCTIRLDGQGIPTTSQPSRDRYVSTQCQDYQIHRNDEQLYLERVSNKWVPMTCPQGTTFDSIRCACLLPERCQWFESLLSDPTKYWEIVGTTRILKSCRDGFNFIPTRCTCRRDGIEYTPPRSAFCRRALIKYERYRAVTYDWAIGNGMERDAGCRLCSAYRPYPQDNKRYEELVNNAWVVRDCQNQYEFNSRTCQCDIYRPPTQDPCNGYRPYPQDNTRYQQLVNNVWRVRNCPNPNEFNSRTCQCDIYRPTPPDPCNGYRPYPQDNTRYQQLVNNVWRVRNCPNPNEFNSRTCQCDIYRPTPPATTPAPTPDIRTVQCPDTRTYPQDPHRYEQLENGRWQMKICDGNRTYDPDTCKCSGGLCDNCVMRSGVGFAAHPDTCQCYIQCLFAGDTLSASVVQCCADGLYWDQDALTCDYKKNVACTRTGVPPVLRARCKATLDLQFNDPGIEIKDSSENQFWIQNDNVTVEDGKAYFNGQARLTVPGLSNNDLGDTVYIKVAYQPTNTRSVQTIAANGDCDVRQSFGICTGSNNVDFYAVTNGQRSTGKVSVPVTIQTRSMQRITYALDEGVLKGVAGGATRTEQVTGPLQRRHSALVIGGGGECGNFQGYIDELQIFRCNPDN